jgi:diazepam-binding inhibitor (GABA receptor modulating acyl-CoA-binding protein)
MSDSESENSDKKLQHDFEKATKHAKKFANSDNHETLLFLYSHYKQATTGDCDIKEPNFWDVKGKAKYSAWKKLKGISNDKAKIKYIKKVKKMERNEK